MGEGFRRIRSRAAGDDRTIAAALQVQLARRRRYEGHGPEMKNHRQGHAPSKVCQTFGVHVNSVDDFKMRQNGQTATDFYAIGRAVCSSFCILTVWRRGGVTASAYRSACFPPGRTCGAGRAALTRRIRCAARCRQIRLQERRAPPTGNSDPATG